MDVRSARDDPSDVPAPDQAAADAASCFVACSAARGRSSSPRRAGATSRLLDLAARGRVPPDRVFLYFHWFRETPRKLSFLRRMAAPAAGHRDPRHDRERRGRVSPLRLRERRAAAVSRARAGCARPARFRSGACSTRAPRARTRASGSSSTWSNCSPRGRKTFRSRSRSRADHYGKYDAATRADIARLEAMRYPPLTLIRETPSPEEYAANFPGSICLQPYDRAEFRDRVSGVTLDALAHGCPIVATAGTWSAAHDRAVRRRHRACRSRCREPVRRRDGAARGYARYQAARLPRRARRARDSWAPLLERLDVARLAAADAALQQAILRAPV